MITYWHLIFFMFKIFTVTTTKIENKSAQDINHVVIVPKLNERMAISKSNETENNKSLAINFSTFHLPTALNDITKNNGFRHKHTHRVRRNMKKMYHHNLSVLPPKTSSILSLPTDPKEIKINFSTLTNNNNNDASRMMINLTQELINFEKISSSLLSKLTAIANNNNYDVSGLIMNKSIKQEKDKSSDNTNNSRFTKNFELAYEVPVSCNKSKYFNSNLCNQHSPIFIDSSVSIGVPLSAKNKIPTHNNMLVLPQASNGSTNIQHQSMITHPSLKSERKLTSVKKPSPKFLRGVNNDTTQTGIIIIDGFGVFENGPVVDDIAIIPEYVENIKTKLPPIFRISDDVNNARQSDDRWKQWIDWNVESHKLEKFPGPVNDQSLPRTIKDNTPAPIVSKNNHFNDFNKKKKKINIGIFNEKKMDIDIDNSKYKKNNIKIDIIKISNGKNDTRVVIKTTSKEEFQSSFLSTFYISILVCGLFFGIAIYWRRFSLSKRANFSTISDSIHSSSTRDFNKPLIAS